MYSKDFIAEIPKTDLHLHLDGSLRLETLIDLAKKNKVEMPSYTVEGLREKIFKDDYESLPDYLHGFMYTCAVLRDLENLERCSYELAIDNQNEGVRYCEIRFAPQLHMDGKDLTMERVFEAVNKGLKRAEDEFNSRPEVQEGSEPPFHYGIIACAMRMFGRSSFSPYYTEFYGVHKYCKPMEVIKLGALELAKGVVAIRDKYGIPIVGFDLAGQEAGYPAGHFAEAYSFVHRHFMQKTVHAGEAYGAESIFQAIKDLHTDRIGHGYYLFDRDKITDPDIEDKEAYIEGIAGYIADRRITIEVCLTSNLQTNAGLTDIKKHSFRHMLDRKLSTTFCTDNRLISNTTVSKEIELGVNNFDIDAKTLKNIIAYGFKRSFYHETYSEKRKYTRQVMTYYDQIAEKYGIK